MTVPRRLALWVLLLALLAAGCGGGAAQEDQAPAPAGDEPAAEETAAGEATVPDDPDSGVTAGEIRVGWMGGLTGPTAGAQTPNNQGTEAYFAKVNEEGGVLGRELVLVSQDDQYSQERILQNFTSLVEDERVLAIIQMGQSEQFQEEVEQAEIPLIAPPQTSDANLGNPYSFNVMAHYGDQADIAVARLAERVGGVDQLVLGVLHLAVPSGQEWNAYVQRRAEEQGATYTEAIAMDPALPDASVVVQQVSQLVDTRGVNGLAFHGSPSAALKVLSEMARVGLDLPLSGIHGVAGRSIYVEGPQEALDQLEATHSFLPATADSPGTREITEFVEGTDWEEAARELNFSHGWVAGMALHQGILRAAEESGELTRATLFEGLQGPIDTQGITCPIDWSESNYSSCVAPFRWDGENLAPVAPFEDWAEFVSGEYGIGG